MNPHWMPRGTVYGTLLNFRREAALWAGRMTQPPYNEAPKAPVLYIKTANTFTPSGQELYLPPGADRLAVGPTIGLVMGDPLPGCSRPGLNALAGCVLLNDFCVPHDSYFRPPVKSRCADGLLGIGSACVPMAQLQDLDSLSIEVRIDGVWHQTVHLSDLVRPAAQLLVEVERFMTLQPGDVLMVGTDCLDDGSRPLMQAGDTVELSAAGFAPVIHTLRESTP
jgi:5-oxopent-3-ene-1,2,5-tricarboxylate decarboxylase / 2-hydroxyhepta-2,4-diene-1,7-dioate isomerase